MKRWEVMLCGLKVCNFLWDVFKVVVFRVIGYRVWCWFWVDLEMSLFGEKVMLFDNLRVGFVELGFGYYKFCEMWMFVVRRVSSRRIFVSKRMIMMLSNFIWFCG